MTAYLVGTDACLTLAEYDRQVARAMFRGMAAGGFGAATLASLLLWPAHPVWSVLCGFGFGAPVGGVVALVFQGPVTAGASR